MLLQHWFDYITITILLLNACVNNIGVITLQYILMLKACVSNIGVMGLSIKLLIALLIC